MKQTALVLGPFSRLYLCIAQAIDCSIENVEETLQMLHQWNRSPHPGEHPKAWGLQEIEKK